MAIIKNVEGQRGLFIPASQWQPPDTLPNICGETIAVDTEVKDNGLTRERGPGWFNKDGHLLGVSIAWSGGSLYVPVAHPESNNFPLHQVMVWLENLFRNNRICFFNCGYDMGWLQAEGCNVWPEHYGDAAVAAVLLDENWLTYSLDDCCKRAGISGKDEILLIEAAASYGVVFKNGSIKHGLWRLPAKHVGPYAEQDAVATLQLCNKLEAHIYAHDLSGAYRTELELIPVVYHMRKRGIRIDIDEAERVLGVVRQEAKQALAEIETPWQRSCHIEDVRSPDRLAEIFDEAGVEYPRTKKTKQPQFQKIWLENLDHPLGAKIRKARALDDLAEKFIANYIMSYSHMGRIHAEIHSLPNERGGAKTLRFAYSNPPLQQLPSRNKLAPLVRGIFLPEKDSYWLAADFKSQEPRLTAHYAHKANKLAKSYGINMGDTDSIIKYYNTDVNPDPHSLTARLMYGNRFDDPGQKESLRYTAKQLNLSLTYRMGFKELARRTNRPIEEAEILWNIYHASQPYIQGLSRFCEVRAQSKGYIKLIDGARRTFPLWQPKRDRSIGDYDREDRAKQRWPGVALERAFAYQAGNSLIQGSAARQIKRAIVACYQSGYVPMLTMHDEIDFSVVSTKQCKEIGELMINAVKLIVPVGVDLEVGTTWGKAKTHYQDFFLQRSAA